MNTPDLHSFTDIHAHSSVGPHILTSVEAGTPLQGKPSEAWYSVGIHPWSTAEPVSDSTWQALESALDDPRVIAVGECGLDRNRGGDAQTQEDIFIRQALLAERHAMPLIVHCVGRYGRLIDLRHLLKPAQPWIVHGFTGKPELARQLLAAGFSISLGPRSPLYPENLIPTSHLFHESDS